MSEKVLGPTPPSLDFYTGALAGRLYWIALLFHGCPAEVASLVF